MAGHPNPYLAQPTKAFWRGGVADVAPLGVRELWSPKYPVGRDDRVVTAGSCFAQHIGRALRRNGFSWWDAEPAPKGLKDASTFGYGVFSFRTGNIYTTALLRQWLQWAVRRDVSAEVWEKDGRWYDPFRPAIEPEGFASEEELRAARLSTLNAIRRACRASVFVFTLGLTEAWTNKDSGVVYPACPGTLAGDFDPDQHVFVNYTAAQVARELRRAMVLARKINPDLRFLLTVSPVPLTATATDQHVMVATTYSKSVLRAVAGDFAQEEGVDYFPSYEIITAPAFKGMFFEPNLREVRPEGVEFVMETFFRDLERTYPDIFVQPAAEAGADDARDEDDVICEEMALADYED